jgi:hypothetical protein
VAKTDPWGDALMGLFDPRRKFFRGIVTVDEITQELIKDAVGDRAEQVFRELGERMDRLMDVAPSDASVSFILRREPGGYFGVLKIYSASRQFLGKQVYPGLERVIGSVFDDVHKQIKGWKRARDLGSSERS